MKKIFQFFAGAVALIFRGSAKGEFGAFRNVNTTKNEVQLQILQDDDNIKENTKRVSIEQVRVELKRAPGGTKTGPVTLIGVVENPKAGKTNTKESHAIVTIVLDGKDWTKGPITAQLCDEAGTIHQDTTAETKTTAAHSASKTTNNLAIDAKNGNVTGVTDMTPQDVANATRGGKLVVKLTSTKGKEYGSYEAKDVESVANSQTEYTGVITADGQDVNITFTAEDDTVTFTATTKVAAAATV